MVQHKINLINELYQRDIDPQCNVDFRSKQIYSSEIINRLTLSCQLEGHEGCVNCIEWSTDGNFLMSGSDDRKIKIWDAYNRRQSCLCTLDTTHNGNIFSVKYIPLSNDNIVVSSAADHKICVHDISTKTTLSEIHSHTNRVKRLAVAYDTPHLFWSCAEDGLIMQHDLRCATNDVSSILVSYASCKGTKPSDTLEVKCMDISPLRSELMAVGCNDPYARLYDRRMIVTQKFVANQSRASRSSVKCVHEYSPSDIDSFVNYYIPGHVPQAQPEYKKNLKHLSVTCVAFSHKNCSELLVNISGEQIYLFNINDRSANTFKYNTYKTMFNGSNDITNNLSNEDGAKKKKFKLPIKTETLKTQANDFFENEKYSEAIDLYNQAIAITPDSPILFGNLAATLMKRRYNGDLYEAIRYCYQALARDHHHMKSHFRLSRCLHELKWHREAKECLDTFCKIYPDYVDSRTCEDLVADVDKTLAKINKAEQVSNKRKGHHEDSADTSSSADGSSDGTASNKCQQTENFILNNSIDYVKRYVGHCNVATDIKEANFIGEDFIGAGSDDGLFYIWNKHTTNLVRVLKADESILNCVQPNRFTSLIATSGIDQEIRLWEPSRECDYESSKDERVVKNVIPAVESNQKQMNANPMEFLFMNMNNVGDLVANDDDETSRQTIQCRTS